MISLENEDFIIRIHKKNVGYTLSLKFFLSISTFFQQFIVKKAPGVKNCCRKYLSCVKLLSNSIILAKIDRLIFNNVIWRTTPEIFMHKRIKFFFFHSYDGLDLLEKFYFDKKLCRYQDPEIDFFSFFCTLSFSLYLLLLTTVYIPRLNVYYLGHSALYIEKIFRATVRFTYVRMSAILCRIPWWFQWRHFNNSPKNRFSFEKNLMAWSKVIFCPQSTENLQKRSIES